MNAVPRRIIWKDVSTWEPPLTRLMGRYLKRGGLGRLERMGEQDLCYDDRTWVELLQDQLDIGTDLLTDRLARFMAPHTVRMYHACRTDDAGRYIREGIKLRSKADLVAQIEGLVDQHPTLHGLKDNLAHHIHIVDSVAREEGTVFLTLDDRFMIEECGGYLIYGSEFIRGVLGRAGHPILRTIGTPTIIEVDLPLAEVSISLRRALAAKMAAEWIRIKVNRPDWTPRLDFTVALKTPVVPAWVVGHYHPTRIIDPLYGDIFRKTASPTCRHCRQGA